MNSDFALYALLVFAAVSALCIMVGGLVFILCFRKAPAEASTAVRAILEGSNALRVLTVFGVLGTTTVLLFADKLSEGVLALLSGIVGYVLGGLHRSEPRAKGKTVASDHNHHA